MSLFFSKILRALLIDLDSASMSRASGGCCSSARQEIENLKKENSTLKALLLLSNCKERLSWCGSNASVKEVLREEEDSLITIETQVREIQTLFFLLRNDAVVLKKQVEELDSLTKRLEL